MDHARATELANDIRRQQESGVDRDGIRQRLLASGYSDWEIETVDAVLCSEQGSENVFMTRSEWIAIATVVLKLAVAAAALYTLLYCVARWILSW